MVATASKLPVITGETRKILAVLPSWIGDACMATPALEHISRCAPSARITLAGRPMLAPLLEGLGFCHEFAGCTMRSWSGLREARRLGRANFDACLLFPNSFRSALFARLVGAPMRAGSHRDARAFLLTHALRLPCGVTSAVDHYCQLAESWTGSKVASALPHLEVTREQAAQARHFLDRVGLGDPAVRVILVNPGANREDKRWPADRFARAACALMASMRLCGGDRIAIAVTGGPSEADLCAAVARAASGIDLCAAGISLALLKGVIPRCAILLTNDTGPRHIAAALGVPTVSLFGPTDPRWTPLDYPSDWIVAAEPFMTADRIADDHAQECAIDRIAVSDVVHAGIAVLARQAGHPAK